MDPKKDPRRNSSGCMDLTAYEALKNIEHEEEARFKKLLSLIFSLCELSGFHLEGRITVKDKKTGRIWR